MKRGLFAKYVTKKRANGEKKGEARRNKVKEIFGTSCWICEKEMDFTKPRAFALHHVNYEKDKCILICNSCHRWIHRCMIINHPFRKRFGEDMAAIEFAKRLLSSLKKSKKCLKRA